MIADVGLIGMPSVGKSTILSNISACHPKIASYHFTTLSPNLGVVTTKSRKTFVMADLPGLIEGASKGVGLGDKFLKHATRAKILVHVLDMGAEEGRDPIDDYKKMVNELSLYDKKLVENLETFVNTIIKLKPASVKGNYIKNISVSSTMGPGIKVENNFDK